MQDRLFDWAVESRRLTTEVEATDSMTHLTGDGQPKRWTIVPDRQAICRRAGAPQRTVVNVQGRPVTGMCGLYALRPQSG